MKSKRIQSHTIVIIVWCLLASLMACSSQTTSVTSDEGATVNSYDVPEIGLSLQYPDDFVLKEWKGEHINAVKSVSILNAGDAESGGGMLPEVFITVYENDDQLSLDEWIEQHNVEDELPFYDSPQFVRADNINNIDVIHFVEHDFMDIESQFTLFETKDQTHIIQIGYVWLQHAYIARAYWHVLESMTLE